MMMTSHKSLSTMIYVSVETLEIGFRVGLFGCLSIGNIIEEKEKPPVTLHS